MSPTSIHDINTVLIYMPPFASQNKSEVPSWILPSTKSFKEANNSGNHVNFSLNIQFCFLIISFSLFYLFISTSIVKLTIDV